MMLADGTLGIEPWCLRERPVDLGTLSRTESLFALSNGHVGVRGTLDEGEPHELPGTYLNSVYELRPLPYAEGGYGYPESGQTLINITNGKVIRLLVNDEPLDIRYGNVRSHERCLDFRSGVLDRNLEWESPAGQAVRVTSRRLVSFTHRAVMAMRFEVEALETAARVVTQSELVANEQLPPPPVADPRVAAALDQPLLSEEFSAGEQGGHLVHRVRRSGIRVGAAMDHQITAPGRLDVRADARQDWARTTATASLQPGQRLTIVKYVAYGWSTTRSLSAVRDQVAAALTAARATGWDELLRDQRRYLEAFWDRADVEVDGDPELQQAVRFALFHVLQAAARAERRPIPAKGLTGPGYDGHTFWDTEVFVLPVLIHTAPAAAADALRWRHETLPLALERAHTLGLSGATFPWRTITGHECSGYWPAGTAAFHVNADVAAAVISYLGSAEDEAFERDIAVDLLVHTARLWLSLGHHDLEGRFRIDGVTGPDEYSALADNNTYTNLMAARNLHAAATIAARHHERAAALGVNAEEIAAWRDAAAAMVVPYDDQLQVHQQAENFTKHEVWNFAATPPQHYPLLLHYPYFDLYRKQVVKQPDLVLAMYTCASAPAFTAEQKRRNFDYYEALTVRDSSLSACTQAVIAAEVGHLNLAYDYAAEAALMDLRDLNTNTREGLHMASLAGAWIALVCGFGGMRNGGDRLIFRPRLPEELDALTYRLLYRGARLTVRVTGQEAAYTLSGTDRPIDIDHHDQPITLQPGVPVSLPLLPASHQPEPSQPPGRAPHRRRHWPR